MILNGTSKPVPSPHGANPASPGKLLRLPAVEEITGLKKSTLYAKVKDRTFPAPVRLSARAVAWRSTDVSAWVAARITVGGQ